jgi:hypothetical protein
VTGLLRRAWALGGALLGHGGRAGAYCATCQTISDVGPLGVVVHRCARPALPPDLEALLGPYGDDEALRRVLLGPDA